MIYLEDMKFINNCERLTSFEYKIGKRERLSKNKHNSFLIWFTGFSGAGKSTIANSLEVKLFDLGICTYALDGDNIRNGINTDLGFSIEDRSENIRRAAEISKLLIDGGLVVLASFISPFKNDRDQVRHIVGDANFIEVFINTSIEVCEERDVKGLYKKVRNGEIKNFTGISSPYEIPESPDIVINTVEMSIEESTNKILNLITEKLQQI